MYQYQDWRSPCGFVDRTVRLLQDLLNLARADSGYAHYHLKPLLLNDLVAEVVQMTEKYSDRSIRVEAIGNVEAIVDRDRLKQVLRGLLN
jgi:signal transduction histidine kinase